MSMNKLVQNQRHSVQYFQQKQEVVDSFYAQMPICLNEFEGM